VEPLFKAFYILIGCSAGALFTDDAPSAIDTLKRLFPNWKQDTHERVDIGLVIFFGTFLAFLYDPADQLKAVFAGLGAVSLLKQTIQTTRRRRRRASVSKSKSAETGKV
jgi:hypothetical protein